MKWAERDDCLYVTVEASNATDVKVTFEDKKIIIVGQGITAKSSEPHTLQDAIQLYKEIKPAESTFKVLGTCIQINAIKTEKGYWGKLVEGLSKGWLSVDWNLWKDEDDEETNAAGDFGGYGDLSSMMGGAGGMDFSNLMGGQGLGGGEMDSDDEENEENLKDLE